MKKRWGIALLTALLALSTATAQTFASYGDWSVEFERDRFTDQDRTLAYVEPTEFPPLGRNAMLGIMCHDQSLAHDGVAVMFLGMEFMAEQWTDVLLRVDSKPAIEASWFSNDTTVGPTGARVREFLTEMLDGQELAIRISAYRSRPTYVFPIRGLREALQSMECYTGPL